MHLGAVTELKMHGIFLMEETSGMENMFFNIGTLKPDGSILVRV